MRIIDYTFVTDSAPVTMSNTALKPPRDTNREQAVATRRSNKAARDLAILDKFNHLYGVTRLRFDDCIAKLAAEFYISEPHVTRIIRQTSKP